MTSHEHIWFKQVTQVDFSGSNSKFYQNGEIIKFVGSSVCVMNEGKGNSIFGLWRWIKMVTRHLDEQ